MRSFRPLLLTGLVAMGLLAVPSASRGDTYMELKGGVYVPTAGDAAAAIGNVSTSSLATGGDVELALGWKWGLIGAQLSAGYLWSSNPNLLASGIPFTGVIQLRLPIFFIQPYVELGLGGYVNTAKLTNTNVSETKISFVAVGGAGVDFILGSILLGVEGRYLYISPQDFTFGTPDTSQLKMSGVIVTANIGYIF
jgi:hypothetical protein